MSRDIAVLFDDATADITLDEILSRPSSTFISGRSKPAAAITAFAAVIVGGLIIGLLTQPSDPALTPFPTAETPLTSSASPTTSTPDPSTTITFDAGPSAEVFVPPTRSQDGLTHVALTLLDGSHIRLAYPDDLDLTSRGVEVQSVGHIGGDHNRLIGVHYGSPESLVDRFENLSGDSEVTAEYDVDGWASVEYREFAEISYLVYDMRPWTVYIWDGAGALFTDEAREIWAQSLFGETYDPGFLVLRASAPLELVPAAEEPGPDGPDITINGLSGSLLVFIEDCDRLTRLDEEEYGQEVFAFCDEATNTLFFVTGGAEVQQRIHESLLVDPPVAGSESEIPILDQETDSQVFFSTDTHLTTVDVDAGSVDVNEMPALAPGDPPYRLSWRGDALVFYGETEAGGSTMAVDPAEIESPWVIKEETFFIPAGVADRVWTFAPSSNSNAFEMQEHSATGESVSGVALTPEAWPMAAVEAGVLFQTESDSLGLWDADSQRFVQEISGTLSVSTFGNKLVTCDACDGLTLIDLDQGTEREVSLPVDVVFAGTSGGAFSPDGRFVAVVGYLTPAPFSSNTESVVLLVDFELGAASIVPGTDTQGGFPHGALAWSESGWLFVGPLWVEEGTADLLAYRPGQATAYRVPGVPEGVYHGMASR